MLFNAAVLLVAFLLIQDSHAQDYTRWGLPEGAKVRLGKGWPSGRIAYSPDGTRLAVASSIGIWLYDAHTGAEVALLPESTSWIIFMSFLLDGSTLASARLDRTVRLWKVGSGQQKATFTFWGLRRMSLPWRFRQMGKP